MDAEKLIRTIRNAAICLRATRGRRGNVVHLDDADDVVIGGDLHGNLDNLRGLLELADLEKRTNRHLVLQEFVHGSARYPNGACTSHQLLDVLATLKCQYPHRVHLLMGNHELAEWTGRRIAKDGVSYTELFVAGVETAYPGCTEEVMAAYREMISSMVLGVRTPNRIFASHSFPPRERLDEFDVSLLSGFGIAEPQLERRSSLYYLLWGRDVSAEAADRWAEVVDADLFVTGHIACEQGYSVPNHRQVIVDCVDEPACCVVVSATEAIEHQQLRESVVVLPGR
ncbi:hypothetical protein Pan216_29470 [Planctomycetes bacterium Pan216]|uniref:Calcineurin-like phosphoesterase domain-containing protein n=1 Tax=Kolteria novifilia TaxID=2527975 RepID=A0A518B521_9BACT|nr:hypothetical protein Pan216_29470 [Planctomycetes bacterium Pan216]